MRATVYGGAIGLAAAAVKSFAPWSDASSGAVIAKELIGATLAFALLCGIAAALRNFIQRRLRGAVGWAKSSYYLFRVGIARERFCPRVTRTACAMPTLRVA